MAKLTIHGKPDDVEKLKEDLPPGVDWASYLRECVDLRKRIEGRELHVSKVDTRPVEEKR